ncbi:DUF6438 domain-containing protein [Mucilaginibacter sp. CSA2-8R]|uniref:DUF6438 domain-containing protein n=1 Tax=Mucilaginibacter sp. CSA2-8R TaxID=3141542 RepID=UPI00315D598B
MSKNEENLKYPKALNYNMHLPKLMRCLILLLLLLTGNRLWAANAIDSLQTDHDVELFATRIVKEFYQFKKLVAVAPSTDFINQNTNCDSIALRWKGKNWQKADFNQDGKTDLFVILHEDNSRFQPYIIMDDGPRGFTLHNLKRSLSYTCELARVAAIGQQPALLYYYIKEEPTRQILNNLDHIQVNTLIYKFGGFVEYNRHPQPIAVNTIYLKTFGAWAGNSDFELTIRSDGKAIYKPLAWTSKKTQQTGIIAPDRLKEITGLLSYIRLRQLKSSYAVTWSDDQTAILKISLANGSVKTIDDYGLRGTFGLSHLYKLLFDLRTSEVWH